MRELYSARRWHDNPGGISSLCGNCKYSKGYGRCVKYKGVIPRAVVDKSFPGTEKFDENYCEYRQPAELGEFYVRPIIILISPSDRELQSLLGQWNNKQLEDIYLMDQIILAIKMKGERIDIDIISKDDTYFEEGELCNINIRKQFFYKISYTNKEIMEYFIQESSFSEGSFMDNNHAVTHGKIVRYPIEEGDIKEDNFISNNYGGIVLVEELKMGKVVSFIKVP